MKIPGRITNDQLLDAFVSQGLATEEQLKNLLDAQRKKFVHEQSLLAGKALLIDPNRREMIVLEFPEEKEFKRIPLSKHASSKLVYNPAEWQRWGSHLVLLNPEDGTRVAHYDWQTASLYGLIFCDKRTFLYNESPLKYDYLAMTSNSFFGATYTGSIPSAPFDLALSPSQRWLCIADRAAGTVTVYDTWNFESNGSAMITEPGRTLAINMAFDEPNERIFITDNQSNALQILNFRTMEVNRPRFNQGQLGNLVLAPDGLHLYLLKLNPIEELLYLNTETLAVDHVIKLKGELFKNNTPDAHDLMALSPDGKLLMVMTYLDEPVEFTPVISVIDIVQNKTIRRYAFKDGVKPFQLAFASPNPIKPYTKSLEDLILSAGICDAKTLLDIKQGLRDGTLGERVAEAPVQQAVVASVSPAPEPEPEKPAIQIEINESENKDKVLNEQPIQSNHIDLPPEANDEIIEILVATFQKQVNEDISGYEDVMLKLRDIAEQARQELEEFDSTIVQIDDLFEGRSLQTAILREAILMMLDLKASAKSASLRSVPSHCPNCKAALLGNWDCAHCGFEVESPERAAKRRIASADAIANLPLGHIVMPDPQGLRLLQLNPYKYVVWNLDPDQLACDYPVDALWLKNQNVMVVDRDGNRVVELAHRGQIEWAFNTGLSPRHCLKDPVKLTYYIPPETPPDQELEQMHMLLVDQGQHRVIEINRQHEILREFGVQAQAGSDGKSLNLPSDVQYTHEHTYLIADTGNNRVLEFEKNGTLKKVIGAAFGLKKPTAAQRLFNDHTLILDSGNDRLLELDAQGEIFYETQYYTRAINDKYRVISPLKMIRLINKNIMIIDEDKLIQVRQKDNKLLWYSMTEDLAFQPKVAEPEIVVDENGVSHKVYNLIDHGHIRPVRLSQKINFKRMHKLIEARLRNESIEEEELDGKTKDAANRLRALIEDRKLEQKRSLQQELSLDTFQPSEIFEKPETDLLGIRIYCLDRNHNAFIRINRKGEVKWHYGFEMGQKMLKPHYYSETKRTILIADAGNNRILEIAKADKEVIAEFKGPADNPLSGPRSALRLSGTILQMSGREEHSEYLQSNESVILPNEVPIVVLINQGTASASEIIAAALQENGRAILIGETSFGKGLVQSLLPLDDGSGLSLSTHQYLTSRGQNLHQVGLEPDIPLLNEGDPDSWVDYARDYLKDIKLD